MASVSQNGWSAITSGTSPLMRSFPWVTGRVRTGDVYAVFDYLARRFDAEVEPITRAHSWGWAYRDIRGATRLSNHASGTAVDFNAPKHPLGARGTFSSAQVRALRSILAALGGVVRWGGDYSGRADEMHFEINASSARVAQVAASLGGLVSNPIGGGGSVGIPNIPGAPAPIEPEGFLMALSDQKQEELYARVMGFLTQRYDAKGNPARALDTLDGQTLRSDIAASTKRAVAETSAAYHQLVAIIGNSGATDLDPGAIADSIVKAVGPDIAAQVRDALTGLKVTSTIEKG